MKAGRRPKVVQPIPQEEHHPQFSGEREPMRFDNDRTTDREEYTGHRTNGKGGWIRRNRGHKPEYKDRRLRAAGSSITRAPHMN